VSPSTPTLPPTDRNMWRRLLARAHPDSGGEHELFVWTTALKDYVCNKPRLGGLIHEAPSTTHRASSRGYSPPPRHRPEPDRTERVLYDEEYDFERLTRRALSMADEVEGVHARLLLLLVDCYEAGPESPSLYKAQRAGASYKQLAFLGHLAGMNTRERSEWYRICEEIPLSQRHAGHIIARLQARAA
jgi:hypothetical protein